MRLPRSEWTKMSQHVIKESYTFHYCMETMHGPFKSSAQLEYLRDA